MAKNIKIQVWTDLFYCRVIGIWRPEESSDYKAPVPDTRSEQEKNVPYFVVLSSVYQGRQEVIGANPIAPSQHPMPKEFMENQIRHISHMFANEIGIFQPPNKAIANSFLAKQTVNYSLVKEINMTVSTSTGSMSLEELKLSIDNYSIEEQKKIKIMITGEAPQDAYAKDDIDKFIHNEKYFVDNKPKIGLEQYISVTKLMPIYQVKDPYISNASLPSDINDSLAPGTEDAEMSKTVLGMTQNVILENTIEQETLKTFDAMKDALPPVGEGVTVTPQPTKEEVLIEQLKQLKA